MTNQIELTHQDFYGSVSVPAILADFFTDEFDYAALTSAQTDGFSLKVVGDEVQVIAEGAHVFNTVAIDKDQVINALEAAVSFIDKAIDDSLAHREYVIAEGYTD